MGLLQKERVLTYPDTPKTILTRSSAYKLTAELPPMGYAPKQLVKPFTLISLTLSTSSTFETALFHLL